jgi:hypothetical protein
LVWRVRISTNRMGWVEDVLETLSCRSSFAIWWMCRIAGGFAVLDLVMVSLSLPILFLYRWSPFLPLDVATNDQTDRARLVSMTFASSPRFSTRCLINKAKPIPSPAYLCALASWHRPSAHRKSRQFTGEDVLDNTGLPFNLYNLISGSVIFP